MRVGALLSNETKELIRKGNQIKIISKETCLKISVALKGRVFSESHKNKIRNALKGRKRSEETKAKIKISKATNGFKYSEESKRKMSESTSGVNHPKTTITKNQGVNIYNQYSKGNVGINILSDEYNLSDSTIRRIVNCVHWTTEHLKAI